MSLALLLVFLALGHAAPLADGSVRWWQTAQSTSDRLTLQSAPLSPAPGAPPASWDGLTISLGLRSQHQRILGFGGAFTQAAGAVFQRLPPRAQKQLVSLYFDREAGIGFNLGRIPIGSCDFSPITYSLDDMAGDTNLSWFDSRLREDTAALIPLLQAALAAPGSSLKAGKLFGSPWSPPAWMKSNDDMLSGGSLLPEAWQAWALYFTKWVSAYSQQQIPIWGVTVQNEPEAKQPWESCVYNASGERDFVARALGPRLRADHPGLKIMGYDHNKDHLTDWADALVGQDSLAADYVDGLAFHWYAGNCFEKVRQVAEQHPSKFLLATEATYELTVVAGAVTPEFIRRGNWSRGEGYGFDILGDLRAGAAGWVDWNIVLDQDGGPNHVGNNCDAAVLANTSSGQLYLHPQYWYLGHFSKFVPEGAVRIDSNSSKAGVPLQLAQDDCTGWPAYGQCTSDELQHVAFRVDEGTVVVVVMNCADSDSEFALSYGEWFRSTAPAHSIQTYVIELPR